MQGFFFSSFFLVQLGGFQRRGECERGGEGSTEGRAAQSQKEGEHSSLPRSSTNISVVAIF